MALTRPAKHDQFFITLLLPGGQKLEAKGFTKAPTIPPLPKQEPALEIQPVIASVPDPVEVVPPPPPTIVAPVSIP